MRIYYSDHIAARLNLRGIEHDLPQRIFEEADERYFDNDTGHFIAVMKASLYNKIREVMVAYVIEQDCATLLTIHPLKEGQKESRINTGRWRERQ
jgi:hypothetical protein